MLTAVKGVLVIGSSLVRNLQAGAAQVRIFEQVDVGALVEPVVRWIVRWRSVEIVNIGIASDGVRLLVSPRSQKAANNTHSVATFSSPGLAAILCWSSEEL